MLVRSRRRVSRLGIEITETECSTPSPPPPHKPIIMQGTDGSNPSPSSGESRANLISPCSICRPTVALPRRYSGKRPRATGVSERPLNLSPIRLKALTNRHGFGRALP